MSKPASASPPYTGSPLGDSGAQKIGEFTATLCQQPTNFQAAIASLRKGLKYHQPGYAMMPYSTEFIMADGTVIKSQIMVDSVSSSGVSDMVRLSLSKWDGPRLTWCIIDIIGDTMTVTVNRNPPEVRNEWRKPSPTIIPPPADGTNA